jgi:hypothetical protein
MKAIVIAAAVIVLAVLHQDFWLWKNATLVFGFLPIGLAYHVGYAILIAFFMWGMVAFAWPEEIERTESFEKEKK